MPVNILLPQVTRIPIAGPEPYNTLVCVSVTAGIGPQQLTEGKLSRFSIRVPTPFRLAGFDQRIAVNFEHSSTAWIHSFGPFEDGNWLLAVDSVIDAGFSPVDGTYYMDFAVASMMDGAAPGTCIGLGPNISMCIYFSTIQATSWVLCYEPPPPSPGGAHKTKSRFHLHPATQALKQPDLPGRMPVQSGKSAAVSRIAEIMSRNLGVNVSVFDAAAGPVSSAPCTCESKKIKGQ